MTEEVDAGMFEAQQVAIDQQRSQADTALRKIERLMNTFIVFPSMAAGGTP